MKTHTFARDSETRAIAFLEPVDEIYA